jgi:carbon storage regulator
MALVLGRKTGESIIINGNIKVTVIKTEDGLLKLSIEAPKEVNIVREEMLQKRNKRICS